MTRLVILGLFGLMVVACGGNQKADLSCTKDWSEFGKKTAEQGKTVRIIDAYKDACGTSFTDASLDNYLDGYARGLIEYCTYEQGYEHGYNNITATTICPYEIREVYMRGFKEGEREFELLRRELERARNERENEDWKGARELEKATTSPIGGN